MFTCSDCPGAHPHTHTPPRGGPGWGRGLHATLAGEGCPVRVSLALAGLPGVGVTLMFAAAAEMATALQGPRSFIPKTLLPLKTACTLSHTHVLSGDSGLQSAPPHCAGVPGLPDAVLRPLHSNTSLGQHGSTSGFSVIGSNPKSR